jgi:hypothetical protein
VLSVRCPRCFAQSSHFRCDDIRFLEDLWLNGGPPVSTSSWSTGLYWLKDHTALGQVRAGAEPNTVATNAWIS